MQRTMKMKMYLNQKRSRESIAISTLMCTKCIKSGSPEYGHGAAAFCVFLALKAEKCS